MTESALGLQDLQKHHMASFPTPGVQCSGAPLKIAMVIQGDIVICLWGWYCRLPPKIEPQSGMLPQPCLSPSVPESFGGIQGLGSGWGLDIMNVASGRAGEVFLLSSSP